MAYDKESKFLVIHIRDTGKGIEPRDLEKLFNRFGKLRQEGRSVNKEVLGLGLTICEAIVVQSGGLIEVQSLGLGKGTLFIFSMRMEIADTYLVTFGDSNSPRQTASPRGSLPTIRSEQVVFETLGDIN